MTPFNLHRAWPWLNVPAAVLLALLQRAPALRVATGGTASYVLASPMAQVLRAAFSAAALGAVHSLAGATTFIISAASPIRGTVGQPITPVSFTYNGTPTMPASFQFSGALPPGLSFSPLPVGSTIRSGTPVISGTPSQGGTFTVFVQGFNPDGLTNNVQQPITFTIEGLNTAPAIVTGPLGRTVAAGSQVTFSVTATGSPVPTYQWRKDGANIAGATGATLTLTNVQPGDAGAYSVLVSNAVGSVASPPATLTVTSGPGNIAFTTQPVSQTIAAGTTVVFSGAASGATLYQWHRDGADLPGATGATLVLRNASTADQGAYAVTATNGSSSSTSNAARLTVAPAANFGRLINLSILTDIPAPGESFTMGYVVGGTGTAGAKPLVIRAAGPSLGALGVPGTLANPQIELFAGSSKVADNDNWGGGATLANAMAAVGAFAYARPDSLDAAAARAVTTRDNSVKVAAADTGTGTAIAEIYDATPAAEFNLTTPRLINVSVLKHIGTGLTAGFVVGGPSARTVLIRAVGPTLGGFGVDGVVTNPRLTLFAAGGTELGGNDDWGGGAALAAAFNAVGAFTLPSNSADAALLVTLPPGNYTVEVKGAGTTTGVALVEVYEVP